MTSKVILRLLFLKISRLSLHYFIFKWIKYLQAYPLFVPCFMLLLFLKVMPVSPCSNFLISRFCNFLCGTYIMKLYWNFCHSNNSINNWCTPSESTNNVSLGKPITLWKTLFSKFCWFLTLLYWILEVIQ